VTITKNNTMMTIAASTRYIAWVIAFPLPGLVNKVMDHTTLRQSISTQMVTATGLLRERFTQTPDTVEEQLALLVVEEFVKVALLRLAKDGPLDLVTESATGYPLL
jgi:hypothetical protein